MGAVPDQPELLASGTVADSVIIYALTPIGSDAVKAVIGITRLADKGFTVKVLTIVFLIV